jgi:hypothetical protein
MVDQPWTLETLKEHFDALRAADREAVSTALAAAEKAVAAAMAASEKAILKAENAADKRAEASNEIRGAMVDAQKSFADKAETERRLKMLEDAHIADASKTIGASQLYAAAAAIVVAVGALITIIFKIVPGGAP